MLPPLSRCHPPSYPYNLDFDYGPLEGLQKYSINNLGDPFIESNYGVHSREFEIGVLQVGGQRGGEARVQGSGWSQASRRSRLQAALSRSSARF